jgi:hypothetical protein
MTGQTCLFNVYKMRAGMRISIQVQRRVGDPAGSLSESLLLSRMEYPLEGMENWAGELTDFESGPSS